MISLNKQILNQLFEYKNGNIYWRIKSAVRITIGDLAGSPNSNNYMQVKIEGYFYKVHNIIYIMHHGEIPEGFEVDHKDRDSLNNHIENLELATKSENACNRNNSSEIQSIFPGVTWESRKNRWRVSIQFEKKTRFIGYYKDEIEGALEYINVYEYLNGSRPLLSDKQIKALGTNL